MKKVFSMVLTACLLMSLLAMGVSAAEPTILWDFGEDSDIEDYMTGANTLTYYGEEDYHVFIATGSDPYVTMNTPADDVSGVQWAKVRVKNPGPALAIELFGATSGRALAGPECTHIDVDVNGDEWLTYIINVPEENVRTATTYKSSDITEWYWEGTLESIRLDPIWVSGDGDAVTGDEIYIDYIAFFATEEDAKAFRAEGDSADETPAEAPTETAAPEDTTAPAETTPETVPETTPEETAPTAPQTSDMMVVVAGVLVLALGVAIFAVKKTRA